jgi:hypothetical protein
MKTGVSTAPWAVSSRPRRAFVRLSQYVTLKLTRILYQKTVALCEKKGYHFINPKKKGNSK